MPPHVEGVQHSFIFKLLYTF